MSFFRRIFGKGDPEPAEEAAPPKAAEASAGTPPREAEAAEPSLDARDPALRLQALGDVDGPLDEESALRAADQLVARGREARAIDLARRILTRHPEALRLAYRVAELLGARGDDAGAAVVLAPFLDADDAPLELWMLGAELAERTGEVGRALALYERVVARDLDHPRARERVARLREGLDRQPADAGATLMLDGALSQGRFQIQRELGRGGAGTVFVAEDRALGRQVALKVYHRRGRSERERLLVEARVPARFEHPGVIRILDVDDALYAIAMEKLGGGAVRRELTRGTSTLPRALVWMRTTAEALSYVHEGGYVHRDIKPSNILLREDDRAVLTDFGLATPVGEGESAPGVMGEGTLAYMPPEQRAGEPARFEMDVYAFGATFREVLGELADPVDPRLDALFARCLADDLRARPGWPTIQAELASLRSAG